MDVRMLGTGRPWALEVRDSGASPPTQASCAEMERQLNEAQSGAVAVTNLRVLTPAELAAIKAEDGDKEKSYVAVCWAAERVLEQDLEALAGKGSFVIQQQTPIRVSWGLFLPVLWVQYRVLT
jgi:tRNA pseudouridine synthase 10